MGFSIINFLSNLFFKINKGKSSYSIEWKIGPTHLKADSLEQVSFFSSQILSFFGDNPVFKVQIQLILLIWEKSTKFSYNKKFGKKKKMSLGTNLNLLNKGEHNLRNNLLVY
jgi:hypothetical protein